MLMLNDRDQATVPTKTKHTLLVIDKLSNMLGHRVRDPYTPHITL